jgi:hypothetical protein
MTPTQERRRAGPNNASLKPAAGAAALIASGTMRSALNRPMPVKISRKVPGSRSQAYFQYEF